MYTKAAGNFGGAGGSESDDGDPQDKKNDNKKKKSEDSEEGYKSPPKDGLPGFPEAGKGAHNPKSKRWRWRDGNGDILEWDKQHGEVEKYDKTGKKHKGAYDPNTGELIKSGVPGRTTPKFVSNLPVASPEYFSKPVSIGIGISAFVKQIGNSIKEWWNAPSAPCNCD